MRCLVTGCAGFIGSHLTEALLAQGHEVVGVDAFAPTYERWAKERNLVRATADRRFRLVEADLAEAPLADLVNGIDVVFHLAGEPGVRQSWGERFATYVRNNVLATERLLNACVDLPLQRFVYAGSSSVYGDAPDLPWRETTCPQPRSPYAISKLAAEHLCTTYHLSFGVPATILRYFTVYGPRQRPDMAFHRWLRAGLTGTRSSSLAAAKNRGISPSWPISWPPPSLPVLLAAPWVESSTWVAATGLPLTSC